MTKAKPPELVSISFACNNGNTGMFEGKFSAVHIGDGLLDLDNKFWPPKEPALSFNLTSRDSARGFGPHPAKGYVKISRRSFQIVGYKYGWGNWCWDLVVVKPETAIEIIDYLKSLDCFTCESGAEEFFDKFDAEAPIDWTEEMKASLRERGWQRP